MGGIGGPELLLVLLVVLVVFGPRRIPEIARGLGRGMRELQRLSTEFQREMNIAEALEGRENKESAGRRPGAEAAAAPAESASEDRPRSSSAPKDDSPDAPPAGRTSRD